MMPCLLKDKEYLQARGKMPTYRSPQIIWLVCHSEGKKEGIARKGKSAQQGKQVSFNKLHDPHEGNSDFLTAAFQP